MPSDAQVTGELVFLVAALAFACVAALLAGYLGVLMGREARARDRR